MNIGWRISDSWSRHAFYLSLALLISISPALAASHSLGLPQLSREASPRESDRIALGKLIFFDKRLSANGTISCATCHEPRTAFSDRLPVARGIFAQPGTRNTPSLWNVAFATSEFWDGRRASLEDQAADPLLNPREHGLERPETVVALVRSDPSYVKAFALAFDVGPSDIKITLIAAALASFERTLIAGDSAFDRYLYGAEPSALSAEALRGMDLFRGRAGCATCHLIGEHSALLTDNLYHRVGVGASANDSHIAEAAKRVMNATPAQLDRLISGDAEIAALGRFAVTKNPKDIGCFKTPTLRNVALTAPYMHDGGIASLKDAIETEIYYRSAEMDRPLILTPREKADLEAFLNALTSPIAVAGINDWGQPAGR
jgi:cytochrome c peroxidase